MKELSLFTGAGGGILGTKLLGWQTIGYVEWNEYCQRVLRTRMQEGHIDTAPLFGDIRAFVGEGYADRYRGVAEIITAGFPCQPFSVAGKNKGEQDERNMWPATRECIRVVGPPCCLLENVPNLLAHEYFGTILRDLADLGYNARWTTMGANEVGHPHRRKRIWVLAYTPSERWNLLRNKTKSILDRGCVANKEQPGNRWQREAGGCGVALGWSTPEPEICIARDGVAHRMDRLKAIGNGQVPQMVEAVWWLLNEGCEAT